MAVDKNGKQLPEGISLRKDGRYQARYTFNGKRYSIYDNNLKNLQKKLRTAQYEVEHGIHTNPNKLTVDIWFNTWINEYKSNSVKKGTLEKYINTYNYYIKQELGDMLIKSVKGEHIQKLYNKLHKQGYSASIIKSTKILLTGMMGQAVKNELIIKDVTPLATMPRFETIDRHVLSREEQQLLVDGIKGSRFECLILLALSTGMRIGELTGLQWEDVDFVKQEITVNHTLKHYPNDGFILDTPKTKSSHRTIPLLPNIVNALKQHEKEQNNTKLSLGDKWMPLEDLEHLIFTGEFGNPINPKGIPTSFKRLVININKDEELKALYEKREPILIKSFTPHTLRHTFATRALENNMPPKIVQEILGHSSITMTLDLYTHVLPETKAEEMNKLAQLF